MPKIRLTLLLVFFTLLVTELNAEQPTEIEKKFEKYVAALNRGDHAAVISFWTPQLRSKSNLELIAGYRAFELATKTLWTYKVIRQDKQVLEVDITEGNDYYDALGLGPRTLRRVYRFQNGSINEIEDLSSSHKSGEDYGEVLKAFKKWLHDQGVTSLFRKDGTLIFDAKTPKEMVSRAGQWRSSQGGG